MVWLVLESFNACSLWESMYICHGNLPCAKVETRLGSPSVQLRPAWAFWYAKFVAVTLIVVR